MTADGTVGIEYTLSGQELHSELLFTPSPTFYILSLCFVELYLNIFVDTVSAVYNFKEKSLWLNVSMCNNLMLGK